MNEYIQEELIENTYLFCAKRIADKEALQDLVCEYAEIIGNTVEKLLLPYVRKDLMSTFIHWDMKMFSRRRAICCITACTSPIRCRFRRITG